MIDNKALMALVGTEMDWVEDDLKAEFVFNNPNSKVHFKIFLTLYLILETLLNRFMCNSCQGYLRLWREFSYLTKAKQTAVLRWLFSGRTTYKYGYFLFSY